MRIHEVIILSFLIGGLVVTCEHATGRSLLKNNFVAARIDRVDTFIALLPKSAADIEKRTALYIEHAREDIKSLLAVNPEIRSYSNTVYALDRLMSLSDVAVWANILQLAQVVYPQEEIREAAYKASVQINNFFVEEIFGNKAIYDALSLFTQLKGETKAKDPIRSYALHHFLELLQRSGLALPENERKNMQQLNKEIEQLCLDFERNIAASSEKAAVTKDELAGLSDDFINSLERSADGLYLLGTDYPTMNQVLGHCTAESTREKLWVLFENRGYPANEAVLRQLVEKRNQLAAMLDFKDFAHFDLDNQMAHTPETAEQFLATLSERSAAKAQQEVAQLTAELPPSVTLTDEGKLKQWSTAFLQNSYKKKHFNIDERELSSYFPLENTIQQLLAVYKKFMSLDFEEIKPKGLWHEEVRTLKVYNKDRSFFYGYLFLDLHPRPFKFTHAAQFDLIKAFECEKTGLEIPAVAAVVANFPRAQGDKPALLMRQDATTFFHEFGHALHTMLGITHFARLSGTGVKSDFVELPSQILEEWLYDPAILRMVSKHYQTGEPLPDDIIEKIIGLKKLSTGLWTQRQIFFAIYSLRIFGANAPDPADLMEQIFGTYFKHHAYDARSHFYDSFGHLTGYGAKYYGYLWSKVFALDVFNEIKNEDGLLSPIVGKRYVDAIIRKGGTKDPNELLFDFLHRKPTIDAFLKDMGL